MDFERFAPHIAFGTALLVGVIFALVLGTSPVATSPSTLTMGSTTIAVVSNVTLPQLAFPTFATTTEAVPARASSTTPPPETTKIPSHETAPVPSSKAMTAPQSAPVSEQLPPQSPPQAVSNSAQLNASAAALRAALVNIICYTPSNLRIHSISGSGVIISPQGYILTNAHVAQYFLLTDKGVSCTIRTGSPAQDAYTAELAFISPAWIHANASVVTEAAPSGTGEHDYALLAISGSADGTTLPARTTFPFIPPSAYPPTPGSAIVIGSYGAQFLAPNQIQSALFPTVVFGSVKDVFTFGTNTIDVLALGGSAAAQEGSSGGGIASSDGALVGTITTSTVTGATASRSLDAITSSYIRGAYASETGRPLESLLMSATSSSVAAFASDYVALEKLLLHAIGI